MYELSEIELEKQKLKTVIGGIKEGIIIVDTNKNISEMNPAAEQITGYARLEALGKPIGQIVRFFDADVEINDNEFAPVSLFEMEGLVYNREQINLLDRNQNLNIVNIQTYRIKGGSKINLGCIIRLDNVSAQSEFERMKLDFVSMSVHTLRTPVTILRGYISQLLTPATLAKLTPEEIDKLNSAMAGGTQLRDLVEKILSMSELQQTGGFSKFTIFDLDGLVLKVVKEFADPIKQKGLELLYVPPIKKLPMIKGDISKIEEVVRRLLDNAMTFTDEGKISVSLEQNGEFLEVWIKDTGRGIPAKNLPYVFNKFYRIKTALEMEQGTGISLYLCKKIIDNHKGTIGVQSIEGQGSSFYFSVPISK